MDPIRLETSGPNEEILDFFEFDAGSQVMREGKGRERKGTGMGDVEGRTNDRRGRKSEGIKLIGNTG